MATSAFRIPCFMLCSESTLIQSDYTAARDECREQAEQQAGASEENAKDKEIKTKLVTLFSDCMQARGWSVPAPGKEEKKEEKPKVAAAPVPAPAPLPAETKMSGRAEECRLARENIDISQRSKMIAAQCDAECQEALKAGLKAGQKIPEACPNNMPLFSPYSATAAGAPAPAKAVAKPKPKATPIKKSVKKKNCIPAECQNENEGETPEKVLDKALEGM